MRCRFERPAKCRHHAALWHNINAYIKFIKFNLRSHHDHNICSPAQFVQQTSHLAWLCTAVFILLYDKSAFILCHYDLSVLVTNVMTLSWMANGGDDPNGLLLAFSHVYSSRCFPQTFIPWRKRSIRFKLPQIIRTWLRLKQNTAYSGVSRDLCRHQWQRSQI